MYKKRRRRKSKAFTIFFLLLVILAILLLDSNYRIVTTEYELAFENLPQSFDGFRIAHLSDIHAAEFGEDNKTLISKVAASNPNIIAVTGDLIDAPGQGEIVRTLMNELVKISPVYYVTGNHEWDSGAISELFDILDECGVITLRNEYVTLTKDFYLKM